MKCIHGIQYCKCLSSACVYLSLCLHISVHTHIHIYTYTCTCTPTRRPTFTGAYYRFQCAPTPFAAFSPFPLPLRPSHPSRPFYLSRPLCPGVRGGRHWRQPLNRAAPYVAAAGHSPSSAMWANGRAADPASWDLRFSLGALGDAQLPETRFRRKCPPQDRISSAPGGSPKSIMSTVLPNASFPKSKQRMLGCWGVPEAGIRARIMSISRAFGAEKPAANAVEATWKDLAAEN